MESGEAHPLPGEGTDIFRGQQHPLGEGQKQFGEVGGGLFRYEW